MNWQNLPTKQPINVERLSSRNVFQDLTVSSADIRENMIPWNITNDRWESFTYIGYVNCTSPDIYLRCNPIVSPGKSNVTAMSVDGNRFCPHQLMVVCFSAADLLENISYCAFTYGAEGLSSSCSAVIFATGKRFTIPAEYLYKMPVLPSK